MTVHLKVSDSVDRATQWYALDPIWQGGEEVIQAGLHHNQLSPLWQMVLLGNGSLTRHLQLLTGEKIEVDVIDMSPINADGHTMTDDPNVPSIVEAITRPRLLRQVWLQTASGQKLAYAASWWNANQVDSYLQDRSLPIWGSLSSLNTELYRDIREVYCGHCPALESTWREAGPFWGRHYLLWHNRQPLTLIYEVFSPCLRQYLGNA